MTSTRRHATGRGCVGPPGLKATGRIEFTIRNLYDGLPVRRVVPCDGLEVRRTGKFISAGRLKRPTSKSASERVASAPSPTRSRFELVEIRSLRAK